MNIRRLLYNPYSSIVISVILGFGLATLFRQSCNLRDVFVFSLSKIENKTFEMNEKCYTYTAKHKSCKHSNAKIIDFADDDTLNS